MKSGKLDRRVTIQRVAVVLDDFGGEIETWTDHATVWAQVLPVSDGERWRAEQVSATVSTRFRIRWGAGVRVTDQIIYEGRTYDIVGVKEIGRREGQEITAAARAE